MYFDLRLFAMTRGLRRRIVWAALIGLLELPVSLGRLALSGLVIAAVIQGTSVDALVWPLLAIAALVVLRGLVHYWREELANRMAAEMKVRLRALLYEHVLRLGPGPFDQQRTGGVLLTLVEGVEMLETFFGQYLPQLLVASLTPLIVFACIAWLDLPTASIFLVSALFTLVVPALFHRWNSTSSLARRDAYAQLGNDFLDGIQGLPTLKAFGQSRVHGARLAARARQLYRATMMILGANIAASGVTILGISAGAALALGWGAVRVQQGELPLQTLIIVLMLGVEVFRPLRELTALYHRGMVAMSATKGIYAILDASPDVQDPAPEARTSVASDSAPSAPPAGRSALAFEAVTFGYPGRREDALVDVSFTLADGETLGVVGPSGAGKSTLVWLLLRFFDPRQGSILLGGHDLRTLPLDQVRARVAVVAQDTYLFQGTVADNLRVGKPDATPDELVTVARAANAHEFIQALPRGYETVVGERGARLSGGQRQRIAIARALLKDAPILVLDEALSSVDAESESAIQQALDRLRRGRTTLVIAHRLSSVVGADRILVLDRGRLVESGAHADLVRANGTYARLMAAQQQEPEIDGDLLLTDPPGVVEDVDGRHPGLTEGPSSRDGPPRSAQDGTLAPLPEPRAPVPGAAFRLWGRLLGLVRPWWGSQLVVFLLGLAHAAAVVGLAVVGSLLVRQVASGGDISPWLWALGTLVPLAAVLTWAESWLAHDLAFRLLAEMRIALYETLDPLAPGYLQRRHSGDLVSAATGDVETVEYFFAHTIAPAFVAVLVPGGVLLTLALIAPPLALVLLPFLILVGLSGGRTPRGRADRGRRARPPQRGERPHGRQRPGIADDRRFWARAGEAGRDRGERAPADRGPAFLSAPPERPIRRDRGVGRPGRPCRPGRRRLAGDPRRDVSDALAAGHPAGADILRPGDRRRQGRQAARRDARRQPPHLRHP